MKIDVEVRVNLKVKQLAKNVREATRLGIRDTVVAIHGDAIRNAQAVGFWDTGHNARSIVSEVSGMGTVLQGADAKPEKVVDDNKLQGAVYSTSGYGGYGETGTRFMAARPYFKPALDRNIGKLGQVIKARLT